LHRPISAKDPVEIARAIGGAQAQDRFAARLSFRSRSRSLRAVDIDRARTEERSLVRTWLMRMTVHLIPSDDAWWMLPLFEPVIERWSRRRLAQLGLPPAAHDKAMSVVERALGSDGPLTRSEVRARVIEAGIDLDQQTGLHIVELATTSGLAIQGPDIGASPSLVLRRDWLGEQRRFDRDAALAELARRYLRGFGPAGERDFAKWAGLPLGDVRAGLEAIAAEIDETPVGGDSLLALKASPGRLPRTGQLRLLGAFDTYVLGYASRDFAVAGEHGRSINARGGGMIEPVIVRDGQVLGTWRMRRRGKRIEAELDPFEALQPGAVEAIEAELADIARFEDLPAVLL
jgi:hypothetical protein